MSAPAPSTPASNEASADEGRVERIVGTAVFALAVVVGGFLRFYELTLKPLHSDEGVNGWFLMNLYRGLHKTSHWIMNYRYDPTNYHGPFLYFAGLVPFFTLHPSNWSLRLLPAVAGTACLLILWPLRRYLGWAGLAMAAWLMALSPPFIFFSRTAIHEIYVFFFSLAAVVCFVRSYSGTGVPGAPRFRVDWMTWGIVSCAFLFTNKETSIITFVAFLVAGALAWLIARRQGESDPVDKRLPRAVGTALFAAFVTGPVVTLSLVVTRKTGPSWIHTALPFAAFLTAAALVVVVLLMKETLLARVKALSFLKPVNAEEWQDYGLAFGWAAAIIVILFTSFFTNPHGAIDMFATYGTWIGRGNEGAGHNKPFPYWIELLREFDAPILWLGLAGTVAALWRRDRFGIFVVVWAWALWFVYSVISYKTPWCNLNFTGPACILAGIAVREVAGAAGKLQPLTRPALALLAPLVVAFWPVPAGPVLAHEGAKPSHVSWADLAWDVNFVHYDDDRYKIVYVQTVRDFETLVDRMVKILHYTGDGTKVWVTSGDYWPMPFYLRDFDGTVGYYQGKIPGDTTLPAVVVSSSTQDAELEAKFGTYRTEQFMLRPGVVLTMWVDPAVYDPLFGAPGVAPSLLGSPPVEQALEPGLVGDYRYGIGCTGPRLLRRVDTVPQYGGHTGAKEFPAPVCVTWTGWLKVDEAADYAFVDASDDGSWIWLDGQMVLPNGGTHGAVEKPSVLQPLAPGLHSIQVRYFDAGGGAYLHVGFKKRGAGDGEGVITDLAPHLFHEKSAMTASAPTPPDRGAGDRAGPASP